MTEAWLHTHLPRLASGETPDVISVKIPGQRIEYASCVLLRDVRFVVHEKGRQRCLECGVRNVHAWVVGTELLRRTGPVAFDPVRAPGLRRAVYDPWKGSAFVDAGTLTAVWEASRVTMAGKDVWYVL